MKMFYSKCLSAKWTNMHKKARLLLLGASVFAGGLTQLHAQVPATCTPSYSTGCTSNDDIRDVILIGNYVTLSNLNTPCPSGGYQDYTGSPTLRPEANLMPSTNAIAVLFIYRISDYQEENKYSL